MTADSQPAIDIYSTKTCSDCLRSRRFLEERGYEYVAHYVEDQPELASFIQECNARLGSQRLNRVPILVIGDQLLSEPTNDELAAALGIVL
jgi:glutaredoxin